MEPVAAAGCMGGRSVFLVRPGGAYGQAMPRGPEILVADDDPGIRAYIRRELVAIGYTVGTVESAQAVMARVGQGPPAALVFGINLSGGAGLALIRAVRGLSAVPVLAPLKSDRGPTLGEALDSGADDCLVKPFSLGDLTARLRRVLRQGPDARDPRPVRTTGDLDIDLVHRRMRRGGSEVKLSGRQWQVLRVLLDGDGAIVPTQDIVRPIWGPQCRHGREYLRGVIHDLRQSIEADPGAPDQILTEHRMGHRFRARAPRRPCQGQPSTRGR